MKTSDGQTLYIGMRVRYGASLGMVMVLYPDVNLVGVYFSGGRSSEEFLPHQLKSV